MTELFVILTACPPEHADAIATHLVTGQHAACVSALPGAMSTYRWQAPGQAEATVQREAETLLLVKVPQHALDRCLAALQAVHPYDVPELVVLPAERVSAPYLAWAVAMTAGLPDTAQAQSR